MTRRMQLLAAEERSSPGLGERAAAVASRVRDGLLRDNKVIPAVLAVLALLIFAWLVAGAILGGPGEEEESANQAALSQAPEDSQGGSQGGNGGNTETPAPGVENRDAESYSAFESKDPFRQIIPKADEGGGNGGGGNGGGGNGGGGNNNDGSGNDNNGGSDGGGSGNGNNRGQGSNNGGSNGDGRPGGGNDRGNDDNDRDNDGGDRGNDNEGSVEQPGPGDPGFRPGAGDAPGQGGAAQGGGAPGQGGAPNPGGIPAQGGNGDLFNSGGDLPPPPAP